MEIDKSKGRWWNDISYKEYNWDKPTLLDDIAYYFYCKELPNDQCIPQITFIYNVNKFNHKSLIKYYNKAKRLLKLKNIYDKI